MPLDASEAGRRGARDGAEGKLAHPGYRDLQHLCERGPKVGRPARSAAAASGAHSRMMPRLVLVPTAANVASTAARMRLPTRAPGMASGAAAALGAAHELRRGHAVAGGKDMNVARLRGVELIKTGGLEGGGDLLGRRGHAVAPRCVRAASAATRSPARIGAMLARVTFCRPDHAGMLLTSSTVGLAVGVMQDVDAGKVRPHRCGGADSKLLHVLVGNDRQRPSALLHVRDPAGGVPRHGGDDAPLRDEQAEIAEAAVAARRRRKRCR